VLGHPIGGRPLLLLGALLMLIGVQLLATGMLGELLTRVYHEPQGRRQYVLRGPDEGAPVEALKDVLRDPEEGGASVGAPKDVLTGPDEGRAP
jgi:hypothetical protein